MDYKSALETDKNNLDEEAVQAPAIFDEFSSRFGEAKAKYESLKDALKVVMADVNLKIRGWSLEEINKFFGLKLPKVSEDVFKNLTFIHPSVRKMHDDIAKARREAGIFEGGKDSMDRKLRMLTILKDLHGQGYFAKIEGGPAFRKISIDLAVEEMASMIADRIDREGLPYSETIDGEYNSQISPPDIDAARAKLTEEINKRKGVQPKTPKTPKIPKPIKRVKAD